MSSSLLEKIEELENILQPSIECMVEPLSSRVLNLFAELKKGVQDQEQEVTIKTLGYIEGLSRSLIVSAQVN